MSKTLSQIIETARRYDLEGVEIIDVFKPDEIARIYNGIGPDRFPDAVRELVTEVNEIFAPAALIHDLEYYIGGDKEDFTATNDRFRTNCYTLVKTAYGWYDPRRYHWLFKAWRFAGYCQKFGWSGYHKTGEKCECTRCNANRTDKTDLTDMTDSAETEVKEDTAESEKEQCTGCENCTCGKHEPEAEPVAKPKTKKKTRKGKKK